MAKTGSVYEGRTFEEAVQRGLDELRMSRAEVVITLIEEGKSGFLGFGSKPFRVSVLRRPGGAIREPEAREERRVKPTRGGDRDRGRGGRGDRKESSGRDRDRGDRPGRRDKRDDRGAERRDKPAGEPVEAGARSERGDRPERGERGERGGRRRDGREGREGREAREPREERRPRPQPEAASFESPPPAVTAPARVPAAASADDEGDDDASRRRRRRGRRGGRGRRRGERPEGAPLTGDNLNGSPVMAEDDDDDFEDAPAPKAASPAVAPPPPPAPAAPSPVHALHQDDEDEAETETVGATPAVSGGDRGERYERGERRDRPNRSDRGDRGDRRERRDRPASYTTPELTPAELESQASQLTTDLLRAMGFEPKVTAKAEGTRVDVTIEVSEDDELLIGHRGEVRQALQQLLNRYLNRGEGSRYHLQLEVNDFWQRREDELAELARSFADEAVEKQIEVVTDYLNSQERRIVHVTLKEDPRVRTFALGTGMIKRVAIAPASFPERSGDEHED